MTVKPASPTTTSRRRGRPARIGRAQIVDAALALGLDSFSLTDIADELGVSTPALYSHVEGRDHVLRLAAARVISELEPALATVDHWRPWLERWACQIRVELGSVGEELLDAVGTRVDAATLQVAEHGLALLTQAGFGPADAGYALWLVFRVACTAGPIDRASVDDPIRQARSVVADASSPQIASAINAIDDDEADDAFAFDLDIVLAGLEARLVR
ncbi:MAG: TetR/AcrR family transcriptional regulator C-terminal domain-containing protein [Acidimicrobiia bacterium]|nr:TetR/AcrR family transcriptional regulator C-terminal domain-containing protein [Acidimicrobiia bacterium]